MIGFLVVYVVAWLAVLFAYGPWAALAAIGATVVVGLLLLLAILRLEADPEEFEPVPTLAAAFEDARRGLVDVRPERRS